MLKKGRCLFCAKETLVAPVESWNGRGRTRFYCQEHYFDVVNNQEKQKNDFINYYSNEEARSWLDPKTLELYNRLTKK